MFSVVLIFKIVDAKNQTMFKYSIITSFLFFSLLTLSGQNNKSQTLKDTIKDESIQVPLDLDYNLEQMMVDWKTNYRQSQTCDFLGNEDVVYPDSVYINRLYSYPTEMELSYNPIVRTYIDMYASPRRRTSVQYMLAKGDYYFPFIEETLDKYGLPLELKYLPVIESALNPVAVSRAGATGLWQFMLRTGKMYGLEVNSLVDERLDPSKSTDAAVRYLKDLYDIYGDWNLVIAAYNCGPGNVNKAIRKSGGAKDYWAIYPNLPRETRGYVPAFIAATYIMVFHSEHNICPGEYTYPVSVDTVVVNRMLHFRQISDVLNIPVQEIKKLNPQYKKDIIPGEHKEYTLCLPSKLLSEFIVKQDAIFTHNTQNLLTHRKTTEVAGGYASASATGRATKTHKIRSGESLGSIALKYGVSVAHLKRMNNLSSSRIVAGKTLVINRAAPAVKKTTTPVETKAPEVSTAVVAEVAPQTSDQPVVDVEKEQQVNSDSFFADYYKSKNSESDNDDGMLEVDSISSMDTEVIANLNHDEIRDHTEDDRTIYHKVKIGETLSVIAKRYNVTAIEIITWNKLPSKKAKIGQRLMIKLSGKTEIEEAEELVTLESANDIQNQVVVEENNSFSKEQQPKTTKVVYRVKKGDSLSVIAQKYRKVTPKDIMLANNLKSDKLSIGQKLNIPVN